MVLTVSVLGPVEASTDGFEYPMGGPKQCGLLVQLVMARGRALSADRLINDLWEGSPPRNPTHALQARISRLRSALPIDIEMVGGGYRVDPTLIETDAERFEQLCELGSASRIDGELSQASDHFGSALDLWQGRAFTGLPDIASFRAESARLEKLWSAALADRIDLDLALGRGSAVIPELHSLVEEHPFTERHWRQLMIALYSEGRVQESLDTFTRARTTFAEQLGIEPSSELGGLHRGILQGQSPTSMVQLPTSVSLLDTPDAGSDLYDLRDRNLTSSQPDALASLLRQRRALLLTGPAGIGKTHLLRAVRTRFEAQRCTVSLLRASPLSQAVPLGIFTSIFPEDWTSPAALIDHFTRHRSTAVLLVDNVDQLDEASLFVISQLIRNSRVPTILSARELADVTDEIQALYDSGEILETAVQPLTAADCDEFVAQTVGAALTPDSRPTIFEAAQGVPLYLREILTASIDEGRLVRTEHGWQLHGDPASTRRLTQLVGAHFVDLDEDVIETAAKVAIAGEFPSTAVKEAELRALTRAGVVKYSAPGWLRLANPLDREYLRKHCPDARWLDLSREVHRVLTENATPEVPAAQRRAQILALELGEPVDVDATLAVAEHALGAFDENLALRAAEAVIHCHPTNSRAHRIAGLATSALGRLDDSTAHFVTANAHAASDTERVAAALAHAQHLGMRLHDATAALAVVEQALGTISNPAEAHHLKRDAMRWSVVAGLPKAARIDPGDTSDLSSGRGLITFGMAGVITGPLTVAERAIARLRQLPPELVELIPGGAALIELTEIMALSNTGDMTAVRRRLKQAIERAELEAPEPLGDWEYALGFTELLAGDAERAYSLAVSSTSHLEWRDTAGLLPSARALIGATAAATGRGEQMTKAFEAIPETAQSDPKAVLLRAWGEAWQMNLAGNRAGAARKLIDCARWLFVAQHTFFAGMMAHCAVRVGEHVTEAVEVIEEARQFAGGGLLNLLARHGSAVVAKDRAGLELIAAEAETLGLQSTSLDTRNVLAQWANSATVADPQAKNDAAPPKPPRSQASSPALWSSVQWSPGQR